MERVDDDEQYDQPRRRGRRRTEVDPLVEEVLRSSMLRFSRVTRERNIFYEQARERLERTRELEIERQELMATITSVNANLEASSYLFQRHTRFFHV
jgi:hypothetical protein